MNCLNQDKAVELGLGLGKLNCLNQDKAVELLGGAERERGWKEEERRGHTAMASLSHS